MTQLPSIELLENTHTFPGPYMFKVIGRVENGFAARVVAAVREELAAEFDPPFRTRKPPAADTSLSHWNRRWRRPSRCWRFIAGCANSRGWWCCGDIVD